MNKQPAKVAVVTDGSAGHRRPIIERFAGNRAGLLSPPSPMRKFGYYPRKQHRGGSLNKTNSANKLTLN